MAIYHGQLIYAIKDTTIYSKHLIIQRKHQTFLKELSNLTNKILYLLNKKEKKEKKLSYWTTYRWSINHAAVLRVGPINNHVLLLLYRKATQGTEC